MHVSAETRVDGKSLDRAIHFGPRHTHLHDADQDMHVSTT
jgi:hypothetical protein